MHQNFPSPASNMVSLFLKTVAELGPLLHYLICESGHFESWSLEAKCDCDLSFSTSQDRGQLSPHSLVAPS